MNKNRHRQSRIAGLVIGIVLLAGLGAGGTLGQTQTKKKPQVAVGLETNSTTEAHIEQEIRMQLKSRGVQVRDQEVKNAARNAMNLVAKEKDPLKGVIYIKTKKFTICISWGADKNFCKSH
jgi:hypothetical protein